MNKRICKINFVIVAVFFAVLTLLFCNVSCSSHLTELEAYMQENVKTEQTNPTSTSEPEQTSTPDPEPTPTPDPEPDPTPTPTPIPKKLQE